MMASLPMQSLVEGKMWYEVFHSLGWSVLRDVSSCYLEIAKGTEFETKQGT